jgi:hypothetical protein
MPPGKQNDPLKGRVQGLASDISELVLRDGEGLTVKVGGAILPTPTLKRGMGNSTVELSVYDPKLRWLKLGLAAEKWDAKIDGLWFRYLGTSKSGKTLTLKFEDRDVARLRELTGPIKVLAHRGQPNEVTQAEFIVSLVEELRPQLSIHCPQLHDKQPIENSRQGKQAQEDAGPERGKGIGDIKGLTVKGIAATKAQISAGDRALRAAESLGAPGRVQVALIMALMEESVMGEESSNWLQIEPESVSGFKGSPTDLEESVKGFVQGYEPTSTGALAYYRQHPEAKAYEIAQAVQRSGAGSGSNGAGNYGPREAESREWVEVFGGGEGLGSTDVTEPLYFVVGKKETYWAAIQRLAQEVNWRAFILAGRFFYISEPELLRSKVRLAIELDKEGQFHPAGIEDVDFDANDNKPVTSATVTAYVSSPDLRFQWDSPPGSVVTLEGMGPASIGFGDASVKANAKGQRIGVSSARNAKTGEGKGRFLVSSIEVPISGPQDSRLATIEIRKPTAPKPEPANETSSSESGSTTGGSKKLQEMVAEADRIVAKGLDYQWGGGHSTPPAGNPSYDCSGFVSRILYVGGFLGSALATSGLVSWGEAGEGEEVTVHVNETGNASESHTVIELGGVIYECGSGSGPHKGLNSGSLSRFGTKRHPPGM